MHHFCLKQTQPQPPFELRGINIKRNMSPPALNDLLRNNPILPNYNHFPVWKVGRLNILLFEQNESINTTPRPTIIQHPKPGM